MAVEEQPHIPEVLRINELKQPITHRPINALQFIDEADTKHHLSIVVYELALTDEVVEAFKQLWPDMKIQDMRQKRKD